MHASSMQYLGLFSQGDKWGGNVQKNLGENIAQQLCSCSIGQRRHPSSDESDESCEVYCTEFAFNVLWIQIMAALPQSAMPARNQWLLYS